MTSGHPFFYLWRLRLTAMHNSLTPNKLRILLAAKGEQGESIKD